MRGVTILALTAIFLQSWPAFAHVRNLVATSDEILTIRAALGIATIIQVPETIQSAIIGDSSGFKVEYLDKAVTIKPLRWGVKTNLYLNTEKRRYNLRLLTLSQDTADYVVYVKHPEAKPVSRWTTVSRFTEANGIRFAISRIGYSNQGFILLDAKLVSSSTETTTLKPDDFWITQNGTSKVINGLFISDLKLSKSKPVLIGISLAKSDLFEKRSLTIELRSKQKISLTLPEGTLWK
ncbi:MAG: TrbG/VirB9 family P-type conjugative transfer protein [Bdellovibrionales bacterium]